MTTEMKAVTSAPRYTDPGQAQARTLIEWPLVMDSLRRRLHRVDAITEGDLVRWLLRRRPYLDEGDARLAVRAALQSAEDMT